MTAIVCERMRLYSAYEWLIKVKFLQRAAERT